jgi:flagellar biosynthesis/type III secretory pathway chaperone
MKNTENDKLRAQTIRAGDRIANLFKQKRPLLLQKERFDRERKDELRRGNTTASIRIGNRMTAIDRRIKVINSKIAPLDVICYQNYRALTGN